MHFFQGALLFTSVFSLKSRKEGVTKPIREYAWEYFFNEEALRVEEVLAKGSAIDYEKSRLRIAFEENILSWPVYKQWFMNYHGVSALNDDLEPAEILKLNELYNKNRESFSKFNFLNQDLIVLQKWDDYILILGLNYSEKIKKIPNALFVLCSPQLLNQITDLNFTTSAVDSLWTHTEAKYFEYSSQARKNFDGFVTLKIKNNFTEVFKMDEDLSKEILDTDLFSFSLRESNPFKKALKSGKSQSFDLSELNLKILDYTSAVVTPLRKGKNTVGFLLGLKTTEASEADKSALENISTQAS